jgi:ATP-binding cassette, subfamily B, bacterial MsbA
MKKFLPYIRYLKPVKLPFIGGILLGLLYGVSSGFGLPFMMHKIFPKILADNAEPLPIGELLFYCSLLPGSFLIRGLSSFFNSLLITYSGTRVLEAIRIDFFRKIQNLQLDFFSKNKTGDLLNRIGGDTAVLQGILTGLSNDIIKQPITLLSALSALVYFSFKHEEFLFILFCSASIPACVFPIRYIGRKLLKRTRQGAKLGAELTQTFTENLLAIKDIRAFCLEKQQTNKVREIIRKIIRLQMKSVKYGNFISPLIEIVATFGVAFTLFFACRKGVKLEIFIPLVSAFYFSYEPMKKLGTIHSRLKMGQVSLERLEYVLKQPITIKDPETPMKIERVRGAISFKNVSFAYGKEPTLTNINLNVKAGTTVAFVGPSGAGKTTMANLLLRFYDVNQGSITIDSINVRDMRKIDLRKNIALVSQDPFLFNDTIYNNILLGYPEATQKQVYEAAKRAYAHEFILKQPKGYDTCSGDRGSAISGGQKQRLAIARAFLRNSPILVLDEATSALDSESEQCIQKALEELVKDRTVFIIAHRFSTIRLAEQICVFNQGYLIDQGTHDSLYTKSTLYRKLYDSQYLG